MAMYCFLNSCKSHCSALSSHLPFLSIWGVSLASNKDGGCPFVWNAEEVTEMLGIKRIKVKRKY